jgi:hypothetical protein
MQFFPILGKNGVFDSKQCYILKKVIITLVLKKTAIFWWIFFGVGENFPVTLLSHCPHPLVL